MTTPLNIGGAASGIQWNDIVDSTMRAMEARQLTPITDRITKRTKQKEAWTSFRTLVEKLNTAALGVRRAGFGGFTATVPPSPSTSRTLLSATATANATAGRYRVEVLQLADTAKIGGRSVTDTTAARSLTGSFAVNGTSIAVEASDSLASIRDKVNAAGVGVTASVVSEGGTAGRLVLTASTSGATAVTITDGTGGVARDLGFVDTRSKPISSATLASASAMGLTVVPQPAQIRIGDKIITADLSTESITAIAAKINAAGASASVESEDFGGTTRFRLAVDGNVSAVDGDANSQAVLDAFGFAAGTTGTVRQTVQSAAYTSAADAVATSTTSLIGLKLDGASSGLAVGDAINIRGVRGDGTAVSTGIVIEASDTMQTLLNKINDAGAGFGAGTRTATAQLGDDGRIRLVDSTGGPSRLSLSLTTTKADGTTGSLGTTTTSVTGRNRQLQTGQDAVLRVDGQEFTRSSNSVTDAIAGVTLNLLTAEPGTAVDVTIDRDVSGATTATKALVDAYNAVRTFFDEQRLVDAPLYADQSLRRIVDGFTESLRTSAPGNATYTSAVSAGLLLDRNGYLTFSEDTFKTAMAAKPAELEALFGFSGVGGAFVTTTDAATSYSTGPISTTLRTISENTLILQRRETDARTRLDLRREQLVAQYVRMEEAISRINNQSGSLLASVQGLRGSN
jgi:flagellar hook-associated protein 2